MWLEQREERLLQKGQGIPERKLGIEGKKN
jgi:hypothetical protein